MANAIEIRDVIGDPDGLAAQISNLYTTWQSFRATWLDRTKEAREYVFATDTRSTTNSSNPWKNSTHIPKLCQIRDNLHANYMATLFPNDNYMRWEGYDESSELRDKRMKIEAYMANKNRLSGLRTTVSQLVYDWIDYGNVFAMPVFVAEYKKDPNTGEKYPIYVGPKLQRISPLDIVFDPTAISFEKAPKIIRELRNFGSLLSDCEEKPELQYLKEALDKAKRSRDAIAGYAEGDFQKNDGFAMDGFSSWWHYFSSSSVEVLHYYGDIYDPETGKLYKDHLVSVIDRCWVVRNIPNDSWQGAAPIRHCGWRLRPDNLYAMGPLENLIGMQYRIDHLENAKADAFDFILHPVIKIKGYVEEFAYAPGERIICSEEGDVDFMHPDVTMLNADTQIAIYEAKMEEMAGAPKQAMGFRTPGEKTAFEVQILENAANRVFINKTSYFEEMFLEPLLNDMLELARRNLNEEDVVRVLDDATGAILFESISREDLTANGKIRPIGARHFAQNATILQNILGIYSSGLGQDQAVMAHISGKKIAEAVQYLANLDKFDLVGDNIRVIEQAETQSAVQAAQSVAMQEQMAVDPEGVMMAQMQEAQQ